MLHKDHVALVYDNGLFVETAVTLAKSFKRVYYYSPWEGAFPKSNSTLIGTGLPGITRILDIWKVLDEVDLFVFPDIYASGLQVHLRSLGKRVWGSAYGEELELLRDLSKQHLTEIGLPVGSYKEIISLDALREFLKSNSDQYVKISMTRGDMEAFHSPNYALIEPRLDELEHSLGAKKHVMKFIVEKAIAPAVEVGYDGYCVDGVFPDSATIGIEVKSKGYLGHFVSKRRMPVQLQRLNQSLAPTLAKFQYRNFFAAEVRITKDGTPWVIDPCCRQGSPPSELLLEMYTNLADIFWAGAEGRCIDPVPQAEWGAQLLLHSQWASKNWQPVRFPPAIRSHVKLRNFCRIKNEYYVIPQSDASSEIGGVVATGSTIAEAAERVISYADQIEGYGIEVYRDCLKAAESERQHLKEWGIQL